MSVLLYCNLSELQYQFKRKGCRYLDNEQHNKQNFNKFKERNREIGNWYKLLYECVIFYGYKTTQSCLF